MNTKKSSARRFLEKLRGGQLTFGQMISSISIADEISQVELARKMKISRAHLCDIERGRRTISIERATEFAKILGYSINQFVAVALEEQAREAGLNVKIYLKAA